MFGSANLTNIKCLKRILNLLFVSGQCIGESRLSFNGGQWTGGGGGSKKGDPEQGHIQGED